MSVWFQVIALAAVVFGIASTGEAQPLTYYGDAARSVFSLTERVACGSRGGPGVRGANGRCLSWREVGGSRYRAYDTPTYVPSVPRNDFVTPGQKPPVGATTRSGLISEPYKAAASLTPTPWRTSFRQGAVEAFTTRADGGTANITCRPDPPKGNSRVYIAVDSVAASALSRDGEFLVEIAVDQIPTAYLTMSAKKHLGTISLYAFLYSSGSNVEVLRKLAAASQSGRTIAFKSEALAKVEQFAIESGRSELRTVLPCD